MRTRLVLMVLGLVAALGVGVAAADNGGRPLSTPLTGAAERPGPGDADATGHAKVRLNQGQQRVCFEISWADIDGTVFAAHIHVAPPTMPGPIVVPLFEGAFPGTGSASGCTENVDAGLIKAIRQNPDEYYVNVHSAPGFRPGAIRGQLGK